MPTKPSVTVTEFASNATYAGLIGDAAVLNGTATKIDGGAAFRSNGAAPLSPLNAQWANYDWNVWSLLLNWLNLGTNAADEDAHVVETDADGRVNAAFGYFTDGAAVSPVVQIDVTGSNDGLAISGTGALTADGAVIDFSGASGGTALNVLGSTSATEAAIEAIGGGNAPAVSATSDSGTGASTASDTALAGATTTGKGVLALSFGSGDAVVAQCTSTNGRGLYVDGTSGGARTVPLVSIESSHTGTGTSAAMVISQSGVAPALVVQSTHGGAEDTIAATQAGTGDTISAGHSGTAGNIFRGIGSATNPDALFNFTVNNPTASGVVATTAAGATSGYGISATGNGGASAYRGIATGTGNAGFFFHSGTGDNVRCNRGSDNLYLQTNAGADIATSQRASDPSVSGTLLQLWGRSIASLSRLAMTYVSGAGRLFVHGSKHGYVYGVSLRFTGSINEPATTTGWTSFGTFSFVQDAFPVSTGGLLYYRIYGRVSRSTIGTINEVGALDIRPYDVTAGTHMSPAINGHPVSFINTAGGEHESYFCIGGTYTIPGTGDRQFRLEYNLAGAGGAGVVDYDDVVIEVWQEERRA